MAAANGNAFTRTIDTAERDGQAARLRAEGLTYDEIAKRLRYADKSGAKRSVDRAMLAAVKDAGDAARQLELTRLDLLWRKAYAQLDAQHLVVNDGRVVLWQGQALTDPMPLLHAIDRLLKISERRAKLLGLDAPTRHEIFPGMDRLSAEIERLESELADRGESVPLDDDDEALARVDTDRMGAEPRE